MPDESVLFDRLTGLEFLDFVGRMYGLPRSTASERSRELMGLFELDSMDSSLVAGYSKGMKKRLALAAALIHRPKGSPQIKIYFWRPGARGAMV